MRGRSSFLVINEDEFSSSISWEDCFGVCASRQPIGEALDRDKVDDDGVNLADTERLAGKRAHVGSRIGNRSRERLDSDATEVGWTVGIKKPWITETCETCGRSMSNVESHTDSLRSLWKEQLPNLVGPTYYR